MPLKADKTYSEYMYNFIDDICKNIGPRLATKPEEHKGIEFIGEELHKYCDETFTQDFKTAYYAYPRGLVRWGGGLCIIGFFFLFTVIPWLCAIFCLVGLFFAVTELLFLKEYLDIFYAKGISKNIFGRITPKSGKPKKYLIFGGHSDSAIELPYAKLGVPSMQKRLYGAIALGVVSIIYSLIKTIIPGAIGYVVNHPFFNVTWLDIIYLVPFIPWFAFFLTILFKFFGSKIVQGANDNLSGCAVACAIAKFLSLAENRPKNIEVICGSFGSEEAGQRGSKAFVKQTPKEILDNSYTVVLESVGGGNGIGILTAETMYLTVNKKFPFIHPIQHHPDVYNRVYKAFENCREKRKGLPPTELVAAKFAGTDATRFSEKGVPACAIVGGGIETMFIKNWHSLEDIPENLNKEILLHALNISLEFVELVDKECE
ncbi:MAG TPA: M28 family peptidase [Candidatus Deferrimicrobium sp.]|nr:M28 family peptidase [Candidatus Deferrimicrobium sp.]